MENAPSNNEASSGTSALSAGLGVLPARVLAMCKAREWSLHWTARGAYLHLEASELIEALRGKRGETVAEAADVLIVLMSITENAGIPFAEVVATAERTVERLEHAPRYKGEEFMTPNAGVTGLAPRKDDK